jgi:DNA-binding GntR family transcriptional regulator
MPNLRLQQSQSLAQRVVVRLRQAITEGEFLPGSSINEEMLAQSFGVSRTPIREALNKLQLEGLVVVKPQVGSFVFSPDADDVAMLCEFRLGHEPWAAELAYRHDREGTLASLKVVLDDMEVAISSKDRFRFARADTAFHETFVNHCGNRYVQEAYRLVAGRVATLRTNYSAPIDINSSISLDGHRSLAEMFARGDFVAFTELSTAFINEAEEALREHIG